MEDLWVRITKLQGQTLRTVRNLPFEVIAVTDRQVIIRVGSSGLERPITKDAFHAAAPLKQAGKQIRPIDVRNAGASEMNPAYVAAILNHILP